MSALAAVVLTVLPIVAVTVGRRIHQLRTRVTYLEGLVLIAHAGLEIAEARRVEAEHVADRLAVAVDPSAPTAVLTAAWAGVL